MAGALTEEEKVQIRHHLGYLNVQEAATYLLGVPAGVQTQFTIELAMNKVLESALPRLRQIIGVLDKIEAQKVDDLELLAVEQVDTIKLRINEQLQLDQEYIKWRAALANLLGTYPNPNDQRFASAGVSVPVMHG